MTTKAKTVAVTAALVVLVALLLWASRGLGVTVGATPVEVSPPAGIHAAATSDLSRPATRSAAERESAASAPDASVPTTATLVVHAKYADDGSPAACVTLVVSRSGEDRWFGPRRQKTDAQGLARFEGLEPGQFGVRTDVGARSKAATLQAGQVTELEFSWAAGIDLSGIVVDAAGAPVAAAEVWYAQLVSSAEAAHVATTGDDGRFALRSVGAYCLIGARAAGRAPSRMLFVYQQSGPREVRIVLADTGGDVEGVVLRPDGRSAADALVRIGTGELVTINGGGESLPPLPTQVRTDRDGRFRAVGLAAGEHPIVVRAAGLAPWTGVCRVTDGVVASLQITLSAGVTVAGSVRQEDGSAAASAAIAVGETGALAFYRTLSAADGGFRLDGLPCDELVVAGSHPEHGKATVRLRGAAGETLPCELRLGLGLVLRGRVLLESSEPVAGAEVRAADGAGADRWRGGTRTDGEGRFRIPNCPDGRLLRITAEGRGIVSLSQRGVDPRAGELTLRARAAPKPSARVVGTFLQPDGKPALGLMVSVNQYLIQTDANGQFARDSLMPGKVRVQLQTTEFAAFQETRELAANETWDLGAVRLRKGGTVRVQLSGAAKGTLLFLHDLAGTAVAYVDPATLRSPPVAPGRYQLRASGPQIAPAMVPVEIRQDEETVVALQCQAGMVQRFELSSGASWEDGVTVLVQIAGASGPLFATSVSVGDEERPGLQCRLLPGAYTVTATAAGRSGRAEFTVSEGQNPTVTVELR